MRKTQYQRVLEYLRNRPEKTANSNLLRKDLFIVDIPKSISILVDKGYAIKSKREIDNTATYTLIEIPVKKPEYEFTKDGRAILK